MIQRSNEKPLKIPWFSHVFTGVRVVASLLFQHNPTKEVMNVTDEPWHREPLL